jgi:hypothetical protein
MHRDDIAFENALARSMPRHLDNMLLDRLASALDPNAVPEVDVDFERVMAAARPAVLSDGLMARLALLAEDSPKIVPMPAVGRVIPFRRYAAAAAIALAGAVAALLAPIHGGDPVVAGRDAPVSSGAVTGDARQFVPAAYQRGLSEACDEGTIWKDNMPHRVLRIVYTDTITLRNDAGETVEVEKPCVEYIVVPNAAK